MTADDNKLPTCDSSPYNACVSWDEESCPWIDLAMISLVLPLSELCLSRTRMTLTTCPSTFTPVDSPLPQEFRSVSTAMKQLCDIVANSRTKDSELEKSSDDTTKCEVSVTTGKFINAGTDGDVYITITGLSLIHPSTHSLVSRAHTNSDLGWIVLRNWSASSIKKTPTLHPC